MSDTATLLQQLLAFVWAPMLVLAGALDWACHRHQRIEFSAGIDESLLHLLMLAQLGAALLCALFLEPTAGLLCLVFFLLALHEASYIADLHIAASRRQIPVVEQWVHGFQHLLPWAGGAALLALAPEQALAVLHLSAQAPEWALRPQLQPPHAGYMAALIGAALLFNVLPFVEEAMRASRATRSHRQWTPGSAKRP